MTSGALSELTHHPIVYRLVFSGVHKLSINAYQNLLSLKFKDSIESMVKLPNKTHRITMLRSPHVHKKSKETFQCITHTFLVDLKPGVDMKPLLVFKPNDLKFKLVATTNVPKKRKDKVEESKDVADENSVKEEEVNV